MQTVKLVGLRRMEVQEAPLPELERPMEVRIRMARVGICGSDVHYFAEGGIGSQRVEYPFTVGHEGAGIVEKVGAAVTRVRVGDRIAIDPALPCGVCDQCRRGRPHTCRKSRFLGCPGQIEGCLAEYVVLPEANCYPVPDTMTLDQAAIVEPLSIGVYAVSLAPPMPDAAIGILGAGPIGLSVLLAARAEGVAHTYMTDKIDARVQMADRVGADWAGNPDTEDVVGAIAQREPELLDAVFECTGDQAAMDHAVQLLKPGGMLLLIGIPGAQNRVSFDINLLRRKEICIQNVRRQNHCVQRAIDLIATKAVDVDGMITHYVPFARTQEGFDRVADYRDGVVKTIVTFDPDISSER
ncbi:MAG: gutB 1 [Chthonomonadales bacterium]|nr:gutB 1 [Chthonomonadales bacterium]